MFIEAIITSDILQILEKWDTWLFLKINTQWTSAAFDGIAPLLRNKYTWVPFYIFMLLMVFYNFGKKSWSWLLFAILTVIISDQISSSFFKNTFDRIRPCNLAGLREQARLLLPHCSGGYSFTSSHAANHFGIGYFFFLTLRPYLRDWAWLFLVWAALVSYAQVYVGVHFPGDILGGTVVGLCSGWLTNFLFQKYFGMPELKKLHR